MPSYLGGTQEAYRSGSIFGLSLAEVILVILFAVLLILIFLLLAMPEECEKDCSDARQQLGTQKEKIRQVVQKVTEGTENADEIPENWEELVLDNMQENQRDAVRSLAEASSLTRQLEEESNKNRALTQQLHDLQGGTTTICTYEADSEKQKISVSLASIWIQANRILLLGRNIEGSDKIIDFYLAPYDPTKAIEIVDRYMGDQTVRILSDTEFNKMNAELNDLGNEYQTETRAECRFALDYFFEDADVKASRVDLVKKIFWNHKRLPLEQVTADLVQEGMHPDDFRQPFSVN